jgi:hypothetical protein
MVDASERGELRNISLFISLPVLEGTGVQDDAARPEENCQQGRRPEPHIVGWSFQVIPLKATVTCRALNVVSGSERAMMDL